MMTDPRDLIKRLLPSFNAAADGGPMSGASGAAAMGQAISRA